MSKQTFHQSLVGKRLVENPANREWKNERGTFKYFGLAGEAATIVGAWIVEGSVKVMVADGNGATAEVYPTLFLLKEAM